MYTAREGFIRFKTPSHLEKNILSNKYSGFNTPSHNIKLYYVVYLFVYIYFFGSTNSSLAGAGQITSISASLYPSHMYILCRV